MSGTDIASVVHVANVGYQASQFNGICIYKHVKLTAKNLCDWGLRSRVNHNEQLLRLCSRNRPCGCLFGPISIRKHELLALNSILCFVAIITLLYLLVCGLMPTDCWTYYTNASSNMIAVKSWSYTVLNTSSLGLSLQRWANHHLSLKLYKCSHDKILVTIYRINCMSDPITRRDCDSSTLKYPDWFLASIILLMGINCIGLTDFPCTDGV